MQWYNGGIAEAVGQSKLKGAIFVVYIQGADEKSESITKLLNSEAVSHKLSSENFVAIKIEGNSVPHQQFSELYKGSPVPSIYFIGKNGVPLEIITESSDPLTFSKKIDDILQRGGISSVQSTVSPSETLITNEQTPPEKPPNVVCENGVCTIKREEPSTSSCSPEGDDQNLSAEEKIERAKKLLEIKRLEKEKEEQENERLKELERRKMGQNVQKMKQWQEDQELKQLKEEREKEKRVEKEARDRVLAQIAQDRAERASKFVSPTQPKPQSAPSTSKADSNVARLQFKLPDGSSNTNDFQAFDTLDTVVKYIKANLNLPFSNFTMSTTFPRRQFGINDYPQTLADLELTPNAVILILPLNHGAVTTNPSPGGVTGFIWAFLTPFLQLFGFLKSFIFGGDPGHVSGDGNKDSGSSSSGRSRNTVIEVRSKYDFDNRVKNAGNRLIVVDCFASWCGPCRMIAPMLEDLARENPNVVFLKINVDDNGGIISGVSALPTFVFLKNGRELTRVTGADYYQVKSTVQRYK